MEIRESFKAELDSKRTCYVQIGFVFSLVVMALLLALMHYFSTPKTYTMTSVLVEMPMEMGKSKDLAQISLPQQQTAPLETNIPTSTSSVDIVADEAMVSDETDKSTETNLNTDSQETRLSGNGSGNLGEADGEEPVPFEIIEDQPTFPGGTDALIKYLGENIRYPSKAKEAGISGTVIISFVVEKDGSISSVKVVHGIGGGCNEEAIRIVSLMPKWTPGKQRGRAIRTQFQIPLIFFLRPK
jgi:protein TonB